MDELSIEVSAADLPHIDGFAEVEERVVGHLDWTVQYWAVLRRLTDDTFWSGYYTRPATQNQPWPGPDDMVTFERVWPINVTVTGWTKFEPAK